MRVRLVGGVVPLCESLRTVPDRLLPDCILLVESRLVPGVTDRDSVVERATRLLMLGKVRLDVLTEVESSRRVLVREMASCRMLERCGCDVLDGRLAVARSAEFKRALYSFSISPRYSTPRRW